MKHQISLTTPNAYGQALAEYGLIGACIAVAVISALLFMGENVDSMFNGIAKGIIRGTPKQPSVIPAPSRTTSTISQVPKAPPINSDPSAPLQPGTKNVSVTLSNGKTISLSNYPTNLGTVANTTGANGTTTLLANVLESVAQQMLDIGQLTPEQYSSLIDLANQGHRMAAIEKSVEDSASNNPNFQENTRINFEGNTYISKDLGRMVGDDGIEGQVFKQIYADVTKQGLLNDPALKTIVGQLVGNISTIGSTFAEVTFHADFAADITSDTASQLTNGKSADICKSGSGKDTGIKCSG